jgi:hypothetical protein
MALPKHRFERVSKAISERITKQVESMAEGLKGDSEQPPYSVRLTKDEQLQQYFSMDEKKWQGVIQERGLAEALRYSEEMQKLVSEKLGPSTPTTVLLAPQQYAMLGEDIQGVTGATQTTGDPTVTPNQENVQGIVNGALSKVGLTPEMVGGGT